MTNQHDKADRPPATRGGLRLCVPAVFLVTAAGCELAGPDSNEPPPMPTAKALEVTPAKSASDSATTERNFNGAVFQVPGDWDEVPPKSGFIDAEFEIPGPGGPARLTLSTARGDVAENVRRWKSQFLPAANDPAPRESALTIDGREATLVELFGEYQDMLKPGEPQPDSAMLGVVVPLRETNYFVKLTGPRETVSDAQETFLKFVESGKFKE